MLLSQNDGPKIVNAQVVNFPLNFIFAMLQFLKNATKISKNITDKFENRFLQIVGSFDM